MHEDRAYLLSGVAWEWNRRARLRLPAQHSDNAMRNEKPPYDSKGMQQQ
mgnify:CR=1 FL=1